MYLQGTNFASGRYKDKGKKDCFLVLEMANTI